MDENALSKPRMPRIKNFPLLDWSGETRGSFSALRRRTWQTAPCNPRMDVRLGGMLRHGARRLALMRPWCVGIGALGLSKFASKSVASTVVPIGRVRTNRSMVVLLRQLARFSAQQLVRRRLSSAAPKGKPRRRLSSARSAECRPRTASLARAPWQLDFRLPLSL
jgi:hypothetical protein